jgi:hypothetical protein
MTDFHFFLPLSFRAVADAWILITESICGVLALGPLVLMECSSRHHHGSWRTHGSLWPHAFPARSDHEFMASLLFLSLDRAGDPDRVGRSRLSFGLCRTACCTAPTLVASLQHAAAVQGFRARINHRKNPAIVDEYRQRLRSVRPGRAHVACWWSPMQARATDADAHAMRWMQREQARPARRLFPPSQAPFLHLMCKCNVQVQSNV